MIQRALHGSGLTVSAVGVSCEALRRSSAGSFIGRAVEMGENFFDVPADCAEWLAAALRPVRGRIVLAAALSRKPVREAVDEALLRLSTDVIDLCYYPMAKTQRPEEAAAEMAALRRAGKVLHWGICDADAETVRRTHAVCLLAAVKAPYSMLDRAAEHTLLPALDALGIGLIATQPIGTSCPAKIKAFAAKKELSVQQVELAWLLKQRPWIVPLCETAEIARLQECMSAAYVEFTAADRAEICQPARPSTTAARAT